MNILAMAVQVIAVTALGVIAVIIATVSIYDVFTNTDFFNSTGEEN